LKFTPRTPPTSGNNKKEIPKSVPITINKALPPLYQLNLRKRSTPSPNTSNPRISRSKIKLKHPMANPVNPTHRPLNLQSTHLKF